jgi:monoamine oxidase
MRVGGRMFTDRTTYANGQLVELGGELIDSNHIVIPALARTFGLELDDLVAEAEAKEVTPELFFFKLNGNNSVAIDPQVLADAFEPVAALMSTQAAASEGEDDVSVAEFERIDALSIPQWLEQEAGLVAVNGKLPLIRRVLELAYTEEYGLPVEEQSAWNMIFLIDFETPDPFRIFGDSDERFHLHAGSDAIPLAIADRIPEQINLDHKLTKVVAVEDRFQLFFDTAGGQVEVEADHVIYALPFTVLRDIDLSEAGMSAEKLEIITELGYGTNAKLMMQFTDKPWETGVRKSDGSVITDVGTLQTVWSTSRGQEGKEGILTNFVGAQRGFSIGEGTAEDQAALALADIEVVFPGTSASYIPGSAIRQHWPSFPFTKGSYASYKVGQWRFFGLEGVREGNQHFCGEHCSEDFQGYMEGGADTGTLVAGEVLDDLGIEHPLLLANLLDQIASKPRASYHGGKMKLRQLRRWPVDGKKLR